LPLKEEFMEKDFCLGLLMGLIGGSLICANSYKARKAVKEGQEQIMEMLTKMQDKKHSDSDGKEFLEQTP